MKCAYRYWSFSPGSSTSTPAAAQLGDRGGQVGHPQADRARRAAAVLPLVGDREAGAVGQREHVGVRRAGVDPAQPQRLLDEGGHGRPVRGGRAGEDEPEDLHAGTVVDSVVGAGCSERGACRCSTSSCTGPARSRERRAPRGAVRLGRARRPSWTRWSTRAHRAGRAARRRAPRGARRRGRSRIRPGTTLARDPWSESHLRRRDRTLDDPARRAPRLAGARAGHDGAMTPPVPPTAPVLVTGCSSGIGRATVQALLRGPRPVWATARQVETPRRPRGRRRQGAGARRHRRGLDGGGGALRCRTSTAPSAGWSTTRGTASTARSRRCRSTRCAGSSRPTCSGCCG